MDADGDGFGTGAVISEDDDCDDEGEATVGGDCDDTQNYVHPGATEFPDDGVDQDCSGADAVTCGVDLDGDGEAGEDGIVDPSGLCEGDGLLLGGPGADCDDSDPAIHSAADEVVDDGVDQDCDGADSVTCWGDGDGDGYGAGEPFVDPEGACLDAAFVAGDCNDASPESWPGNPEACDNLDNDCDPATDELLDGDGDGQSLCNGDCDDDDPDTFDGADELCDGVDNACDGRVELEVPGGYGAVQDALNVAQDGDLVCIGAGLWAGPFDTLGADVTLRGVGASLSGELAVDGGAVGVEALILEGVASIDAALTLDGVTVSGGVSASGGSVVVLGSAFVDVGGVGLDVTDASLVVSDSTFTGGLDRALQVSTASAVSLVGCTFDGNQGGAWIAAPFPTVEGCVFVGNSADDGGGLWIEDAGTFSVSDSTFGFNTAAGEGGGALVLASTGAFIDCTFADNDGERGGGLAGEDSTVSVAGCSFTGNTAGEGGAVSMAADSGVALISGDGAAFTDNGAEHEGGALALYGASASLPDAVLDDNSSGEQGGAIYALDAPLVQLGTSSVCGNAAEAGGGVALDGGQLEGGNVCANSATGDGGGLHLSGGAGVSFTGVRENSADDGAGAYVTDGADFQFVVIQDNTAVDQAGGLFAEGAVTGTGLQLVGNAAPFFGAGVLNGDGSDLAQLSLSTNSGGGLLVNGDATLTEPAIQSTSGGAGLHLAGGAVVVTGGFIQNNSGVGIAVEAAEASIQDTSLSGNAGGLTGSGDAVVELLGCTVAGNSRSGAGGGVSFAGLSLDIQGSVIQGNSADEGGGLWIATSAVIDSTRVHGNAAAFGAGVLLGGVLTATHLDVAFNDASATGGGVLVDGGALSLVNSTVRGNTAALLGGGLVVEGSDLVGPAFLSHVSMQGNRVGASGVDGGSLLVDGRELIVQDSVIVGDLGSSGSAVQADGADVEFLRTAFWDLGADDFDGMSDPVGLDGNLAVDPLFLNPGGGDLHLATTSPVRDLADDSDPDGGPGDLGAFGGPLAGGWDLDHDGAYAWWQPGPWQAVAYYPLGLDCDDVSAEVHPGAVDPPGGDDADCSGSP